MRIALVTRHLADATSLSAFVGLARALAECGHEVVFITQVAPEGKARRLLSASCWILARRDLAKDLSRALRSGAFDHVHLRVGGAHENPLVPGLLEFATTHGAGISLQFDDFDNPDLPTEHPRTANALGRLLRDPRVAVSAISTTIRDRVCKRWKLPDRGLAVIATGVELGPAPRAPGRDILCIGRLSPYKGLDLVLFAFAGLSRAFRGKLILAGYGTKDRYLSELATRLGIADRVQLLGLVSHARVRDLLSSCGFLVMGSRWEALGLTGLEAMAAGRAVIAPRLGGFLDFIQPGKNGLFFEPEDPASLEQAIRTLLERPAKTRAMGLAARRTARRFDWSVIARRYLALWR